MLSIMPSVNSRLPPSGVAIAFALRVTRCSVNTRLPFPSRSPSPAQSHYRRDNCALHTREMPSSARQEALGHELGVACKRGHLERVQRLLAAGATKEIPTPVMGMMMTPLNAAAYTNNVRSPPTLSCW